MSLILTFLMLVGQSIPTKSGGDPTKQLPKAALPTAVNVGLVTKCPQTTPAIVMWSGSIFICASLGTGLSLGSNGVLNVTSVSSASSWQVDIVSLASVAAGATGLSFATSKTPLVGSPVLFWYNSTSVLLASSGAVAYTGNPLPLNLPIGWLSTDTFTIAYQYQ